MAAKWRVNLSKDDQNKAISIYGNDYFPRTFHYKKDAERLLAELKSHDYQSAWIENIQQNK